jgi:hypothetical protein
VARLKQQLEALAQQQQPGPKGQSRRRGQPGGSQPGAATGAPGGAPPQLQQLQQQLEQLQAERRLLEASMARAVASASAPLLSEVAALRRELQRLEVQPLAAVLGRRWGRPFASERLVAQPARPPGLLLPRCAGDASAARGHAPGGLLPWGAAALPQLQAAG